MRKILLLACLIGALVLLAHPVDIEPPLPTLPPPDLDPAQMVIPLPKPPPERKWHSRHIVKTWLTRYEGRIFRTTQIPRCEHVEMVVTYVPAPGQTRAQAKKATGAIAVATGSYHHPQSMALADFVQKDGRVLMGRRTHRGILTSNPEEVADILDAIVRGEEVNAVALGSRLVPFSLDGFSKAFAAQKTDRMAIGLTKGYIFIVQGNSDLYRMARFMRDGLGCSKAINGDGGHVVKGRSPVHVAFRWRKPAAPAKAGGEK